MSSDADLLILRLQIYISKFNLSTCFFLADLNIFHDCEKVCETPANDSDFVAFIDRISKVVSSFVDKVNSNEKKIRII